MLGVNDLRDVLGQIIDLGDFDKTLIGNSKKKVKRH